MKQISKRNYTLLTIEQVKCIKALLKEGAKQGVLGKQFGVSRRAINRIKMGHSWGDING